MFSVQQTRGDFQDAAHGTGIVHEAGRDRAAAQCKSKVPELHECLCVSHYSKILVVRITNMLQCHPVRAT